MSNSQNNQAILEILKEDYDLRQEFHTILNFIMKGMANFDYPKASKMMREYFNFKKLLDDLANLPKNNRKEGFKSENISFPLSLEDRKVAILIRILSLKLSTCEKKAKKELAILRAHDSDYISIIYFEHFLDLLRNPEFRDLLLTNKRKKV